MRSNFAYFEYFLYFWGVLGHILPKIMKIGHILQYLIFDKKFMQICNFHPNWLKFDMEHLYMILQKSGVGIFHIFIFCPTFGP